MKKSFSFFLFFTFCFVFAQSKYTAAQVESSHDPQVIANFIKYNPDHPKTPEFRRKLLAVINKEKSPSAQVRTAKPKVATLTPGKINSTAKNQSSGSKHSRTAELLNHLFNSDSSSRTAYVQIVNKSKCNLIVKLSGKKFYNLDVPANNQNFIMVEKGTYSVTTSVCDAKYSSTKNIGKDIVITLNAPR